VITGKGKEVYFINLPKKDNESEGPAIDVERVETKPGRGEEGLEGKRWRIRTRLGFLHKGKRNGNLGIPCGGYKRREEFFSTWG